jgi:hypothetical protein
LYVGLTAAFGVFERGTERGSPRQETRGGIDVFKPNRSGLAFREGLIISFFDSGDETSKDTLVFGFR